MSQCCSTVVLQRTEERVGVDLVSGTRQITASVIAADVVAMRGNCTPIVRDVRAGRSGVQDSVPNLQRLVDRNTATTIVAKSAVTDSAAAIEAATGQRRVVAAKSAVSERN